MPYNNYNSIVIILLYCFMVPFYQSIGKVTLITKKELPHVAPITLSMGNVGGL